MTLIEMEGFLKGKCLPGDLKVGETNAQYLYRKLNAVSELQRKYEELVITSATVISELQGKVDALAVERDLVAADNSYLRGQIICWAKECDRIIYTHTNKVTDAHQLEAEKELSSTLRKADAALAEIRAQGVDDLSKFLYQRANDIVREGSKKKEVIIIRTAARLADDYAQKLRKEAGQ